MLRTRAAATSLLACVFLLASPASALVDGLRGAAQAVGHLPTHYLSFGVLGDLTNQWECILNAAMLAAEMAKTQPMALVVPSIDRTANGRFRDVYNFELFKERMKECNVDVVEEVPASVDKVVSLSTVQGKDLHGYVESWSPTMAQYSNSEVHYTITGGPNLAWETNEARFLAKCKEKYTLCGPLFESLQYTPQIQNMSKQIVEKLNQGGEWLAVHLHDFTAFLCHGSVDDEIKKIKERLDTNSLKPKQLYIVGATQNIDHIADILGMDKGSVINKQKLLAGTADLHFQESAAVDQGVVREAKSYITKPGSSFDELANGIRRMRGREVATYELPRTYMGCEAEEKEAREHVQAQAEPLHVSTQ